MSGGNREIDLVDEWDQLSTAVGARFTDGAVYGAAVAEMRSVAPVLVPARERGELRAIAALSTRRVGPVSVARLAGHGLGQGGDAVTADASAARGLADRLAERRLILHLDQMATDSDLLNALRDHPRWRVHTRVTSDIPMLTLRPGWTARDVRSGRTLSQLRSVRTKYAAAGDEVRFELLQTTADLDRRWDDMRRVASKRAESRPEWDQWLEGERGTLVRAVLDGEARAGRMRVLGMTAGGQWIGHDIAVKCGTTWARYLTHFDPDHARVQPGHQLMVWIVDHHDELGVDRIHHGRGVTPVKKAWSDEDLLDAVDVWAVPTSIPAAGSVLAVITGITIARVRAIAALKRVARRVLRRNR